MQGHGRKAKNRNTEVTTEEQLGITKHFLSAAAVTGSTREAGPWGGHTAPFWGQAPSRGDPLGSRIQEQGKGRGIHPSTPSSQQPRADGWARGSDHLGAPRGADAALSFPSQPYLSSFCFTSPSLPRLCQHLPAHPRAAAA